MALPSFMSVYVDAVRPGFDAPDESLSIIKGTGFVVEHDNASYLITNGHIVTGRTRTDKPIGSAALPKELRVVIPVVGGGLGDDVEQPHFLGTRIVTLELYDEKGKALWYCHPQFGRRFDVVALPLKEPETQSNVLRGAYLPYRITSAPLTVSPPDEVSVVGFPYGLRGGASTAIWVRGTVATEPQFSYEGEDCFLIDARTREGQSGSPVIQLRVVDEPEDWRLLGVYSSRVDHGSSTDSTDLGRVWTSDVIKAVIEAEVPDDLVYE